jgi:hypothetical protein
MNNHRCAEATDPGEMLRVRTYPVRFQLVIGPGNETWKRDVGYEKDASTH